MSEIDPGIVAEYEREKAELRQARLDEFARAALPAIVDHWVWEGGSTPADVAATAYQVAEAMLAKSDRHAQLGAVDAGGTDPPSIAANRRESGASVHGSALPHSSVRKVSVAETGEALADSASPPALPASALYDAEVRAERRRQDAQWGGPEHDDTHTPLDWLKFLSYHWAEARAAGCPERGDARPGEYRRKLIVIEALARAARESFDRLRAHPFEQDTMSHEQPGAALSDAEVLERAAGMLERHHIILPSEIDAARRFAARLRASAPVDVFEAFASGFNEHNLEPLEDLAREWFAPIVEALEKIAESDTVSQPGTTWRREMAKDALAALRARAGGKA